MRRRRCHHGAAMTAGHDDLLRAAEALAARVPQPLAGLARLAYNYRWSWTPGGHDVYRVDRPGALGALRGEPRPAAAARPAWSRSSARRRDAGAARAHRPRVEADGARRTSSVPPPTGPATPEHPIAYFCAEFGVHRSLPIYSGGLGALAGDILKEASDRALPLVAVGLMYRQGYFRQRIDAGGWQHEYWVDTDPERLPAALVHRRRRRAAHDHRAGPRTCEVTAQIWRVDVGRVPLFLLDTERPENDVAGALDHVAALHRRARTRASRSTCCSASAACARSRRWASSPGSCTSTRATRRSSRSRPRARTAARSPTASRRRGRGRSSRRTRRSRRATTPIPPSRSSRRSPG